MDKTEERLNKLAEQKREIERKMQNIRAKQSANERKNDTRRKVLVGAYYLERAENNETEKADLLRKLDGFLTRDNDRSLFGFAPIAKSD